jgi:hypothetical protein
MVAGRRPVAEEDIMKTVMFTKGNAARFWTHGKNTTIRGEGKTQQPRFSIGETVSLRVWRGVAYRSATYEFGRAEVVAVESIRLEGENDGGGAVAVVWPMSFLITTGKRKGIAAAVRGARDLVESDCERIARRDGFSNWEELVEALALHHGAPLAFSGFRYCFNPIELLNRNWGDE